MFEVREGFDIVGAVDLTSGVVKQFAEAHAEIMRLRNDLSGVTRVHAEAMGKLAGRLERVEAENTELKDELTRLRTANWKLGKREGAK